MMEMVTASQKILSNCPSEARLPYGGFSGRRADCVEGSEYLLITLPPSGLGRGSRQAVGQVFESWLKPETEEGWRGKY